MAKPIDNTKLERIYQATMQLVVENGYGGASISSIAKKAQVSEGYLYRHYKGKKELVDYLLDIRIKEVGENILGYMDDHVNSAMVIEKFIDSICDTGKDNPYQLKFMYALLSSYNFSVSEDIRDFMKEICFKIIDMGKKDGGIDMQLEIDHLFEMMMVYPIQYINLKMKNFFDTSGFSQKDRESLISFCLNAVSPKS